MRIKYESKSVLLGWSLNNLFYILMKRTVAQLKEASTITCTLIQGFLVRDPLRPPKPSIFPMLLNWYLTCLRRRKH